MKEQNRNRLKKVVRDFTNEIRPSVFFGSLLTIVILIGAISLNPDTANSMLLNIFTLIINNVGWVFLWTVFLSIIFSLWLGFGPWGSVKLGRSEDSPQYSTIQFFAMMFSAGFAVGVVFWGPSEALSHYQTAPPFLSAGAETLDIMSGAIAYSFFHQGPAPMSISIVFGIVIGYFAHRHQKPLRLSTIFCPFTDGDHFETWWAKTIDALAIVFSVGGMAVSLGFGSIQFAAGLSYNYGLSVGTQGAALITLLLTVGFTASAAVGIQRGIRRVSDVNMGLLTILFLIAFIFAPTAFVVNLGSEALGEFLTSFVSMSLYTNTASTGAGWLGNWTLFFWAWWLSFGPMIGIFIAKIARGMTIRKVVLAGLGGTAAAVFPWFAILGGASLWLQSTGQADLLRVLSESGNEAVGFALFREIIPFSEVFSTVFLILVLTFLITTVDSSTISIATLSISGNSDPTVLNRVIWGLLVGVLTSLLILAGGLNALQYFVVIIGLPAAILLGIAIVGMALTLETSHPFLEEKQSNSSEDRAINSDD